jgi:hypothetical protein
MSEHNQQTVHNCVQFTGNITLGAGATLNIIVGSNNNK